MNALVLTNEKGNSITTSLIVAEVFGKRHDHVLRDIENLSCSESFRLLNFGETPYIHEQNGQTYRMYEITKDGFSFLVMGYTGEKAAQFKETFINEFNKREAMLKSDEYILGRAMTIMSERMKMLEQSLEMKETQLQLQETVIKEAAPKVSYFENVLQSQSLISATIIAKELGKTAIWLNRELHRLGFHFYQSGVWIPYQKYQDKGYTGTKTHTYSDSQGTQKTHTQFYFTEKGRNFIHTILKSQHNVKDHTITSN